MHASHKSCGIGYDIPVGLSHWCSDIILPVPLNEYYISRGYTHLLPEVALWVIGLGRVQLGFPVSLDPPVTLQIITRGELFEFICQLVGPAIERQNRARFQM